MKSRGFWYVMMIGSVALFGVSMALGRYLFPDNFLLSNVFFIGILLLHVGQIPARSMKIGNDKKIPGPMIIIKTILFGFTWWFPLKQGVINK
jgi:hypothetical protein